MSELIQLRRRISAVQTSKKIAHAMQLIARSLHSRLKSQRGNLDEYTSGLQRLLYDLEQQLPDWQHPVLHPDAHNPQARTLIILIGSQRGLCGSFNSMLIHYYNNHIHQLADSKKIEVILVGNKVADYFKESVFPQSIRFFSDLTDKNIVSIAQEITRHIMATQTIYSSIAVISNKSKGFFTQRPMITFLVQADRDNAFCPLPTEDRIWHISPQELLNKLVPLVFESNISYLLFESFFAEQAARFISMDQSTRNAQKLLNLLKLQYNKLRQARITQELIELSGATVA